MRVCPFSFPLTRELNPVVIWDALHSARYLVLTLRLYVPPSQCCLFGTVWRFVLEFEGIAADETISVVSDLIRAFSLCNGGLIESIPHPMMLGYGTGISWTRKGCAASPCLDEVEGSPW